MFWLILDGGVFPLLSGGPSWKNTYAELELSPVWYIRSSVSVPFTATQGARPHSKPPFLTMLMAGVGAQLAVAVVVEVGRPGLHEQAELYLSLSVPQPEVALVGNPVVAVLIVVV